MTTGQFKLLQIRLYVDREIERLAQYNETSFGPFPFVDGQIAGLMHLKARFLLTEEEAKEVEQARQEMFGE